MVSNKYHFIHTEVKVPHLVSSSIEIGLHFYPQDRVSHYVAVSGSARIKDPCHHSASTLFFSDTVPYQFT